MPLIRSTVPPPTPGLDMAAQFGSPKLSSQGRGLRVRLGHYRDRPK